MLDRIDLHVEVQSVSAADLVLPPPADGSAEVAARVQLKYAAKLKFLADDSFDEASHIEKLLAAPKVAQDLADDED